MSRGPEFVSGPFLRAENGCVQVRFRAAVGLLHDVCTLIRLQTRRVLPSPRLLVHIQKTPGLGRGEISFAFAAPNRARANSARH
ncbi:MAG: hypothetical protein ABI389_07845, partial [Rhodanobacter sp.]